MTKPAEEFIPLTAADLDDQALVPQQLRMLTARVEGIAEQLAERMGSGFDRVLAKLDDIAYRLARLESEQQDTDKRTRALERGTKPNGKPKTGT